MFENWLQPSEVWNNNDYEAYQLGAQILVFPNQIRDLNSAKVAIVGISAPEADAVRKELYILAASFQNFQVVDLGNVRKKDNAFLIPLITELLQSKIIPLLIGDDTNLITTQYQAYQWSREPINFAVVDDRISFMPESNVNKGYLYTILEQKQSHLFSCAVIGCQSHFIAPSSIRYFDSKNYTYWRLGKTRSDMEETEPIIRDADMVCINIGALKQSEAAAALNPTPSGFTTEEACQLCRYAGMSDKLRSFGLYGFIASLDEKKQTAKVLAQMAWYFLDGLYNRKNDFPVGMNHLTEYIVSYKESDFLVTFWKSNKSGRWWIQVPVKTKKKHHRHKLIACSYQDYQLASGGELPERLLNAFKRF